MKNEFPKYMQQGSRGPHVSLFQAFLCGLFGNDDRDVKDLVFDQDYGGITAGLVNRFQVEYDLEADGHFGPATRGAVKERYNFDFEAACRSIPGTTIFIQPDGTEIAWSAVDDVVEDLANSISDAGSKLLGHYHDVLVKEGLAAADKFLEFTREQPSPKAQQLMRTARLLNHLAKRSQRTVPNLSREDDAAV